MRGDKIRQALDWLTEIHGDTRQPKNISLGCVADAYKELNQWQLHAWADEFLERLKREHEHCYGSVYAPTFEHLEVGVAGELWHVNEQLLSLDGIRYVVNKRDYADMCYDGEPSIFDTLDDVAEFFRGQEEKRKR